MDRDFYSRASREARPGGGSSESGWADFYSRASREARLKLVPSSSYTDDFYSRASREARHEKDARGGTRYIISTHAPLARRDLEFG